MTLTTTSVRAELERRSARAASLPPSPILSFIAVLCHAQATIAGALERGGHAAALDDLLPLIEPFLRIVADRGPEQLVVQALARLDDDHDTALPGRGGHEAQRGETHQEAVGWRTVAQAEGSLECPSLWAGQLLDRVEEAAQHLMERAVRERHLRFDADHLHHDEIVSERAHGRVGEQGALADTGLAAQHDGATHSIAHRGQDLLSGGLLIGAPDQRASYDRHGAIVGAS